MTEFEALCHRLDVDRKVRVVAGPFMDSLRLCPVRWRKTVRRLGSFRVDALGEISITINSRLNGRADRLEQLRDTFLHEVAHAVVYLRGDHKRDFGHHGPLWRSAARALGANPAALAFGQVAAAVVAEGRKPVAKCLGCGAVLIKGRRYPRNAKLIHTRKADGSPCGAELVAL